MSDVKVTRSVCSNLFVAFVRDPLDLDLFPPHVSAVAVGGAKGGAWSRSKAINGGLCPSLKRVGRCRLSSPCTPGRLSHAVDGGGGGEEEEGWACGAFLRSWSRGWGRGHPPLRSRALPFTSAQQLLKKQKGDAGVYLFPLTHFSYYKHLVCLRPGRTGAQSGISGAVQSHAATRGHGGGVHVCAGGLWCRAGAPQGPTWREAVLCQLH